MIGALEQKGNELIAKFEKKDKRISMPQATFCGLIFTLVVLTVFAVVICIYNESNHLDMGIRIIAICTLCVLLLGIAATIFSAGNWETGSLTRTIISDYSWKQGKEQVF